MFGGGVHVCVTEKSYCIACVCGGGVCVCVGVGGGGGVGG